MSERKSYSKHVESFDQVSGLSLVGLKYYLMVYSLLH